MIELKQVSKSFGERELFSNLSMTFEAGKVYALIGSSGSGKTTLMKENVVLYCVYPKQNGLWTS